MLKPPDKFYVANDWDKNRVTVITARLRGPLGNQKA